MVRISTLATPVLSMPSFLAALRDRSMMRSSCPKGPRSVIRTRTNSPVSMRLTSTHVPKGNVREVFRRDGPVVCEVMLDAEQPFEPRLAARRLPSGEIVSPSLEDMWPHLDPEELAANMPDWDNTKAQG